MSITQFHRPQNQISEEGALIKIEWPLLYKHIKRGLFLTLRFSGTDFWFLLKKSLDGKKLMTWYIMVYIPGIYTCLI